MKEKLANYQRISLTMLNGTEKPIIEHTGPKFSRIKELLDFEAVCAYSARFSGFISTPFGIRAFIEENSAKSGYLKELRTHNGSARILVICHSERDTEEAKFTFTIRQGDLLLDQLPS